MSAATFNETFAAFDSAADEAVEPGIFQQMGHLAQGLKITSIVLGLINFSIATAIAWSCSNLLIAVVAFVVSILIGALIAMALLVLFTTTCTKAVVALGARYEALVAWLSAKFNRT